MVVARDLDEFRKNLERLAEGSFNDSR